MNYGVARLLKQEWRMDVVERWNLVLNLPKELMSVVGSMDDFFSDIMVP